MANTELITTQTVGGNKNFGPFAIEYIDITDIKVSLDGVLQTLTTQYSIDSATSTVTFVTAPDTGAVIRIFRDTPIENAKAILAPGSSIRAQNLNDNTEQVLFSLQEIKDQYVTRSNGVFDTDVDLNTNRIINLGDPVDPQDAVTKQYLEDNYFDDDTETILSSEAWPDNDTTIATTAAIDDRVDAKIDSAITGDIGTDGTGITVTNDGDGTITLGLGANSIDFDRIKNVDIITQAEQDAGSPAPADTNLFTSSAAARRFDTIVSQAEQSTAVSWEVGKTWLQNDSEKTVRIWDGSAWVAVASGGAFTTLPKVVYVDAVNGDDSLEGHRISNPKRTIKAAIEQINAETDEVGDGSVVIVAPGVYQETAPIDIQKKNVSIIGQALRSCIVHPTSATEENTLFRLNSGSYIANLTLTGVKASGTRGGNALDTNATHGLPTNQGWNFAFFPNATIVKSPYIANCTNFSDSEIDNDDLNAFNPRGGLGGDTDSAPTGGGILIDGSVVNSSSPLRSMVCDSYTHVGLDGPGIFVTNNGYCQATSSYAFFTHYHIKALNGGQANLAASTSDFGRFGLIAEGRSSSAIFTASTTANANSGATTFTINAPTAAAGWHGSATRPQANMVVDVGGNTYSIISATANGTGWDVEISRPDPNNLSTNLGLNGSVASGSAVSFFLRSMIASSGHTMEYVGSGTNYSALPENGGVPVEANEIVEVSDGKVWAATTNHQGKFTVGPTFNVDQVTGYVNIANGAIGIEQLIENLDLNSFTLSDSTGDVTIDDQLDMNTHKIVNVVNPTGAQDAATKNYVDTSSANTNYVAVTGDSMTGDLNMSSNTVTGLGAPSAASDAATKSYVDAVDTAKLNKAGDTMTGDLTMNAQSDIKFADSDSSNWVAVQAPATIGTNYTLTLPNSVGNAGEALITDAGGNLSWSSNIATVVDQIIEGDTKVEVIDTGTDGEIQFATDGTRAMTIDNSQRVGIGTSSPGARLHSVQAATGEGLRIDGSGSGFALVVEGGTTYNTKARQVSIGSSYFSNTPPANGLIVEGNVGVGTTSPQCKLQVSQSASAVCFGESSSVATITGTNAAGTASQELSLRGFPLTFTGNGGAGSEHARIDSSGRLLVGTASATNSSNLQVQGSNSGAWAVQLRMRDNANDYCYVGFSDKTGSESIANIWSQRTGANAGIIAFDTNNGGSATERMRIDSSGRVGIGTSLPDATLHISKSLTDGDTLLRIQPTSFSAGYSVRQAFTRGSTDLVRFTVTSDAGNADKGSLLISTSSTTNTTNPVAAFTGDGRVGIGTTSPGANLHVQSSAGAAIRIQAGSTSDAQIDLIPGGTSNPYYIYVTNSRNLIFQDFATERARITSNGDFYIGSASNLGTNTKFLVRGGAQGAANGYLAMFSSNTGTNSYEAGGGFYASGSSSGASRSVYMYLDADGANFSGNDSFYAYKAGGGGIAYLMNQSSAGLVFGTAATERCFVDSAGHFKPWSNNTYDLGSSSQRWRNIYTNDLNLSNEGSTNDVDGTWGSWTIQEGEDDLFLLNRRNGKKYKFNLTEVS